MTSNEYMVDSYSDLILNTDRLAMRWFSMDDAPRVAEICNNANLYRTLLLLPFPYLISDAETWLKSQYEGRLCGKMYDFAATIKNDAGDPGLLIGCVGIKPDYVHNNASIGFWFDEAHWGNGYCTEAAHAVLRFAFKTLGLHRVFAGHFAGNEASARVQKKIGMSFEGVQREHFRKNNEYIDDCMYSILENEFDENMYTR